jgi:hypothetical protein
MTYPMALPARYALSRSYYTHMMISFIAAKTEVHHSLVVVTTTVAPRFKSWLNTGSLTTEKKR